VASNRATALSRAQELVRDGRLDEAMQTYLQIVDEHPRDWHAANLLGDLYVRTGRPEKAVEQFTRIADALQKDGFLAKAAALYKKILKIVPDTEHAQLQAAEIAAAQGRLVDARGYLNAVAERRRTLGDVRGTAAIVVRLGSLDSCDWDARIRAARALSAELGDTPGAARALRTLAADLAAKGYEARSIEVMEEAARLAPGNADETSEGTAAPQGLPSAPDAGRVVHVVVPAPLREHEPAAPVAKAQQRSRKIDDLSVVLDQIRKPAPLDAEPTELDGVFARMRAEAEGRLGADAAEQDLRRGVELFKAGRVRESIPALEAASRAPRFGFEASAMLGRIFLGRGDLKMAVEWLERAAALPAPAAQDGYLLLYDLADALESMGDATRALAILLELRADAGPLRDIDARIDRLTAVQARG
jgi:tetratricopeptide (TPR) repeat protein